MDTRTSVSATNIFWLSVSCATLAAVLWLVVSNLFIGGWGPAAAWSDSRVLPDKAVSDRITGLLEKKDRQSKAPEQIGYTEGSPQTPQKTAGQSEIIEADPALQDDLPSAVVPHLAGIKVAFRMDRKQGKRLIRTWVSPYSFSDIRTGGRFIIEAKAQGIDTNGEVFDIEPELTPEDPGMILVSQPQNGAIAISVLRTGQSRLRVASKGISHDLTITASQEGQGMRVQIFQQY